MSREIAEGKGIIVRRPNAKELISIRRGEVDLQTLIDKVEEETEVSGIIGEIGVDEDGRVSPGFMLVDKDNKKLGFIMYDAKRDEFIEGESTFNYTYTGKDSKDSIILQLMKDNLV
jgi:hypothetical protein